ncbi:MAG: response regulator [Candidatus Rokuibacteriota bacterium]|jgi:two-component system cell cycle sensor histidine kinase/response regulator CckA
MRTILVVDDDEWVRVLARDVLAAEGYRVLEASDGQDAIRVASEHPGPIHLLLTDVVMPGMNGCELAAGLGALLPGLKVMFMSAYDRDFLVARGLNPTGPVITKPFTIEYLTRRIQMVLGDRRPSAPAPPAARVR